VSDNDNKLKKIYDPKLITSLLMATKEKAEQVLVWKFLGTKKVTASIRITVINKANGTLVFSPTLEDADVLKKIISSSESVNFYIPGGSTLFQCNIKQIESPERIIVYAPKFIAQLERRKWLRLKTIDKQNVRIQFSKRIDPIKTTQQFFRKNIFDLGVGGMALVMTKAESKSFIQGELIKGVELLIDDFKIVVDLEVLNHIELKPGQESDQFYKVWKIGFRFAGLQKKDQEIISTFVFKNIGSSIAV
jgi:hypothetical protein